MIILLWLLSVYKHYVFPIMCIYPPAWSDLTNWQFMVESGGQIHNIIMIVYTGSCTY